MGNSNRNTIIAVVTVLVLLVVAFVYLGSDERKFNWTTDHYTDKGNLAKQPFGTRLFYNYLKSLRPEEEFHTEFRDLERNLKAFIDSGSVGVNYILLGNYPYAHEENVNASLEFVEQGNSIFLLASEPPIELIHELNNNECVYFDSLSAAFTNVYTPTINDTSVQLNFVHPDLRRDSGFIFENKIRDQYLAYDWHFMEDGYFCEENRSFTPLGTLNDSVNFCRVPYGEGFFYFHITPHVFTNLFLLTEDGREYTERAMSHLMDGAIVYDLKQWQVDEGIGEGIGYDNYKEGPLRFILSRPALRWAFYVLLGTVVLSLLFAFQRKQRVIPVRHPKENSSMAYVSTITDLYLQQGGQAKVFAHLNDQFNAFLRERYRIPTKKRDDTYYSLIKKRSGLGPKQMHQLRDIQDKGSFELNVSSELLVQYYKVLNHFYEHCK